MGLKEVLEKLKLVELDSPAPTPQPPARPAAPAASAPVEAPRAGAPRTAPAAPKMSGSDALADMLKSMPPPPRLDATSAPNLTPGAVEPDFAAIYKAAGVTDPSHGFSAFKVLEMLSSPDLAALDTRAKAAALGSFLRMNPAGPVPIKDIIQDAIRRDQALDAYEEFLRKKLESRSSQIDKENAELQAEVDALAKRNREKMESNRATVAADGRSLTDWQTRKRIEERRLYDAVAPFVDANPVTLGPAGGSSKP